MNTCEWICCFPCVLCWHLCDYYCVVCCYGENSKIPDVTPPN